MEQSHSARPRVHWSLLAAAMAAACALHGTARASNDATPPATRPADNPYQLAPPHGGASLMHPLGSYYLFEALHTLAGLYDPGKIA